MNAILTLSKQRPQNKASLVLFWQEWDVQEGDISLPNELEKELIALRTEHASFAFQLGQTTILGQSIADHFLASTPSMYWCSLIYERHPKMTPNLYTIYKLRLVEKFLDKKNIKHLTLIGHDDRLATVLKDLLAAKNRGFTYQKEGSPPPKEPFLKRFYHALPPILRTGIRFLHWLTTVKRKLPKRPLPIYDNTASIVTYFPNIDLNKAEKGRFYSHYWEELHTLLEKQPIRWLFVRFPSPQMHLDAYIAFLRQAEKKALDGVSFSYIEEHLGCGDILHSLKTYFALRKTAKKLSTKIPSLFHFANSALNFWPYAKDDWEESFCGWRALERCIQNRGIQNYVQKAGPQRFYLYPLENCPWERMLTSHVHSQKAGPIYGAQHSTIRPTDFRYFDCEQSYQSNLPMPDLFLANGASAAKQWRDSGMPLDRLTTVTALRYRYLTALKAQSLTCYEKKTLLILTSFFLDETKAH
ncbi:MAG: hypothetical protein IK079_05490, partial [Desulfovibrio sp.]|nr:hypothetical protein [Desulfovibrio sp.]